MIMLCQAIQSILLTELQNMEKSVIISPFFAIHQKISIVSQHDIYLNQNNRGALNPKGCEKY